MSNLDNIRNWRSQGRCMAMEWVPGGAGFPFGWHVNVIRAGHHVLPVIRFLLYQIKGQIGPAQKQKQADFLVLNDTENLKFISDEHLPLLLEDQSNLALRVSDPRLTLDTGSAVQWRHKPDGTLDATPIADALGPLDGLWVENAKAMAGSVYMVKMRELCPNPGLVMIVDNGEVGDPKFKSFMNPKTNKWRTRAEMDAISLRMRDKVDELGYDSDPFLFAPTYYKRFAEQYRNFYAALMSASPEWASIEVTSCGYGCGLEFTRPDVVAEVGQAPQAMYYEFSGPSEYPGQFQSTNLLESDDEKEILDQIPAWEWAEAHNSRAGRQIFVWMNRKKALEPAQMGVHEVTDPPVFAAWCGHLAWMARKPGVPVLLTHWIESSTTPTSLVFDPGDLPALITLGRQDLEDLTHEEYPLAMFAVVDRLNSPVIEDFWMHGEAVAGVTVSDSRVQVDATKLGGRTLIHAWTPCKLAGTVEVTLPEGKVTIDVPSAPLFYAYWITADSSPEKEAAQAVADQKALESKAATDAMLAAQAAAVEAETVATAAHQAAIDAQAAADAIPAGGLSVKPIE